MRIIALKSQIQLDSMGGRCVITWGNTTECVYRKFLMASQQHAYHLRLIESDLLQDHLGTLVYVEDIIGGTMVSSLDGETLCKMSHGDFHLFSEIFVDTNHSKKQWARLRTKQETELHIGKYIPPQCAAMLHLGEIVTLYFDNDGFDVYSSDGDLIESFRLGWYSRFLGMFAKDIYDEQPKTGCNISQSLNTLFKSL